MTVILCVIYTSLLDLFLFSSSKLFAQAAANALTPSFFVYFDFANTAEHPAWKPRNVFPAPQKKIYPPLNENRSGRQCLSLPFSEKFHKFVAIGTTNPGFCHHISPVTTSPILADQHLSRLLLTKSRCFHTRDIFSASYSHGHRWLRCWLQS